MDVVALLWGDATLCIDETELLIFNLVKIRGAELAALQVHQREVPMRNDK